MYFRFVKAAWLAMFISLCAHAHGPDSPYMGGPAEVVAAPNGALVNKAALQGLTAWAMNMPAEPVKVAEGVWQLVGRGLNSPVMIEGHDGLIVWDTGESVEEGRKLLADIRRISSKPVKAIIYSHSHYVNGASAIAEGNEVMVIGHPNLNANRQLGAAGSYFGELAPFT